MELFSVSEILTIIHKYVMEYIKQLIKLNLLSNVCSVNYENLCCICYTCLTVVRTVNYLFNM